MIKRKKKICRDCNTEQFIFSGGRCLRCYNIDRVKQQDARRGTLEARQTTIISQAYSDTTQQRSSTYEAKKRVRLRARKKVETKQERWLMDHFGFKSQVQMFDYMWDTFTLTCPFTGIDLTPYKDDHMMRIICCAHILPKGLYPLYKLNIDNMRLVHPTFHSIVDQGRFQDREKYSDWKWDEWDALVKLKRVEYEEFRKHYLL